MYLEMKEHPVFDKDRQALKSLEEVLYCSQREINRLHKISFLRPPLLQIK